MNARLQIRSIAIIISIGLGTLILDQLTKTWMLKTEINLNIGSFLILSTVPNPGIFLGTGAELPALLRNVSLSTIAAFIVFAYGVLQYFLPSGFLLLRVGLTLLLSGIMGNVVDRIHLGYVIDFISFRFNHYQTPIFNLADLFQGLADLIIILSLLRSGREIWPDSNLRKSFWIHHRYQLRHCLQLLFSGLSFALISGVYSYTFLKTVLSEHHLHKTLWTFLFGYFALTGIFAISLLWLGIRISHEVAGPVTAFIRFLRAWLKGDLKPLKLRKSDQFRDEFESLALELTQNPHNQKNDHTKK